MRLFVFLCLLTTILNADLSRNTLTKKLRITSFSGDVLDFDDNFIFTAKVKVINKSTNVKEANFIAISQGSQVVVRPTNLSISDGSLDFFVDCEVIARSIPNGFELRSLENTTTITEKIRVESFSDSVKMLNVGKPVLSATAKVINKSENVTPTISSVRPVGPFVRIVTSLAVSGGEPFFVEIEITAVLKNDYSNLLGEVKSIIQTVKVTDFNNLPITISFQGKFYSATTEVTDQSSNVKQASFEVEKLSDLNMVIIFPKKLNVDTSKSEDFFVDLVLNIILE